MSFPIGWNKKHKITIDHTKVSGSANLSNFPVLLTEANFLSSVFDNSQGKEIYTNHLYADANIKNYWRFEGNANDSKGSANGTGTSVSYGTSYGKYGQGVHIGSSSSYINAGTTPDFTGSFSISVWVKRGATGAVNYICGKKKADTTRQHLYCNFLSTNAIRFGFYGDDLDTTDTFTDTTNWYHLVFTYNRTTRERKIYVNGLLNKSGTAGGDPDFGTGDFYIGTWGDLNGCFNGNIDDFALFNDVLTATEVLGIYTGGQDIRFSSDSAGSTQLAHEVVNWDIVNDKAEVWVKIPTLSYQNDTTFYVWYDNDTASPQARNDTYGSYSVWSSFRLVTHDMLHDSTSNQYKGTAYNGASETTGLVGVGIDYGSDDYVSYGSQIPCLGNGDFTVETWINIDTLRDWSEIFMQQSSTPTSTGGTYGIDYTSAGKVLSWAYGLSLGTPSTNAVLSTSAGWQQVVATFNHTTKVAKVYVNGVEAVSETFSNTWTFTPAHTAFSCRYLGTGYQQVGTNDGQQDETKIANSLLSDGWIATEYNNQSSPATFATPIVSFVPKVIFIS